MKRVKCIDLQVHHYQNRNREGNTETLHLSGRAHREGVTCRNKHGKSETRALECIRVIRQ